MHLMDEIFREIKSLGRLKDLEEKPSIQERHRLLEEVVARANISKTPLSSYSLDEQLYLTYRIQEGGTDMGLCPHFYIFFSKKNQRFHHVCNASPNKERTYCRGEIKKCDKHIIIKGT